MVLTAAFFLFAALVLFHVLSLAEKTRKKQTTHARAAQQATGNQHARQPVILTAAFLLFAALVLFHVLSLAEETSKKQTTQATTPQQATGNQHARQLVICTAAFLLFTALVLFFLVSLAEEMGEKQTTQASTPQQATDSQLTDKLLLVPAALRFLILTKVYLFVEQSICTHYVLLSVCPSAPPYVPVQEDQPGYRHSQCPWTVDNAYYSRAPVPWPISVLRIARFKTSRRIRRLAALFSINGRSNKCRKFASFSDSTGSSSSAPSPKPQATPASNASSIMASSVALPIFFARLAFSSSESSCCARVPLVPSILMI